MKNIVTVFHDNAIYTESERWIPTGSLPKDCYIRDCRRGDICWYHRTRWNPDALPINASDLPPWIRTLMLVMA